MFAIVLMIVQEALPPESGGEAAVFHTPQACKDISRWYARVFQRVPPGLRSHRNSHPERVPEFLAPRWGAEDFGIIIPVVTLAALVNHRLLSGHASGVRKWPNSRRRL